MSLRDASRVEDGSSQGVSGEIDPKESPSSLCFSGLHGVTGEYVHPPLPARVIAALARRDRLDEDSLDELRRWLKLIKKRRAARDGVDPTDLSQAGWGVIFAAADEKAAAVCKALRKLIRHRRREATRRKARRFRVYFGKRGYQPGDTKKSFLARAQVGAGMANPEKMPYYLLIVGSPKDIPFSFQYQLGVQHAVGRLHFDTEDEYVRYARTVVEAEEEPERIPRQAVLFGPQHPGDKPTERSAGQLVKPLSSWLDDHQPSWTVRAVLGREANKAKLRELLGGSETPGILFTAGHGLVFDSGHRDQRERQGSLVCADWPGPRNRAISEDYVFAAADVADSARLRGLIAFHFACYSGGAPAEDDFALAALGERVEVAPEAFLARLPQRLLGHPHGGALAVVGHVERAWGCSFESAEVGRQIEPFEDCLNRLMDGHPVGSALEPLRQRYAELSSDLAQELQARYGLAPDDTYVADLWTASNDARNYVILGDPAVRVAWEETGSPAQGG